MEKNTHIGGQEEYLCLPINRYLNYLPNIATGQALISHEFVGILKNTFVGQSCFQIEDD